MLFVPFWDETTWQPATELFVDSVRTWLWCWVNTFAFSLQLCDEIRDHTLSWFTSALEWNAWLFIKSKLLVLWSYWYMKFMYLNCTDWNQFLLHDRHKWKKKNNVISACIRPVISALRISQIFIVTGGAEFGGHFVTFTARRWGKMRCWQWRERRKGHFVMLTSKSEFFSVRAVYCVHFHSLQTFTTKCECSTHWGYRKSTFWVLGTKER